MRIFMGLDGCSENAGSPISEDLKKEKCLKPTKKLIPGILAQKEGFEPSHGFTRLLP